MNLIYNFINIDNNNDHEDTNLRSNFLAGWIIIAVITVLAIIIWLMYKWYMHKYWVVNQRQNLAKNSSRFRSRSSKAEIQMREITMSS